jgi:hypothetical protein
VPLWLKLVLLAVGWAAGGVVVGSIGLVMMGPCHPPDYASWAVPALFLGYLGTAPLLVWWIVRNHIARRKSYADLLAEARDERRKSGLG